MYILKNAWTSIIRNKGRNLLIAIIVIVIAASCAVTLSISNSANKIIKSYEEKYDIEASIGFDRSKLMNEMREKTDDDSDTDSREQMIDAFNNLESLTVDQIKDYGNSKYVSSYYYVYSVSMNADGIDKATDNLTKETTETTTETDTQTREFGGGRGMPGGGSITTDKKTTTTKNVEIIGTDGGDFQIKGYSSYESMTDFIDGNYTVLDGGKVSNDFDSMTCVISQELAELNDLEVGDTITLENPNDEDKTYELEITGIYKESDDTSGDMTSMYTNSANTIITNSTVVEKIIGDDDDLSVTVTPTYILKNKSSIDKFSAEVTKKGLSEYYSVTTNIDEVESATKSISNVKTFANTFLIITLIIGAVVLFILNMINIRERKYEIGVLRTIGMKKISVISQFVIELMIVAVFGLLVGAGIGAVSSVPVANSLLQNEISNSESDMKDIDKNFGGEFDHKEKINGVAQVNQVDSINASMDIKVLFELLGIGLLLTIISSLSACIAIARFSPLTILKERS